MDTLKKKLTDFYDKNKTVVMVVGGLALIGILWKIFKK